jgi:hypothetical protein
MPDVLDVGDIPYEIVDAILEILEGRSAHNCDRSASWVFITETDDVVA